MGSVVILEAGHAAYLQGVLTLIILLTKSSNAIANSHGELVLAHTYRCTKMYIPVASEIIKTVNQQTK